MIILLCQKFQEKIGDPGKISNKFDKKKYNRGKIEGK